MQPLLRASCSLPCCIQTAHTIRLKRGCLLREEKQEKANKGSTTLISRQWGPVWRAFAWDSFARGPQAEVSEWEEGCSRSCGKPGLLGYIQPHSPLQRISLFGLMLCWNRKFRTLFPYGINFSAVRGWVLWPVALRVRRHGCCATSQASVLCRAR